MNVVHEDVEKLVDKELAVATEKFGLHHSWHEKYAVTLEEVEEAQYEMEQCAEWLHTAWENIKDDDTENATRDFQGLYSTAVRLACEAIQVAAMCRKEIAEQDARRPTATKHTAMSGSNGYIAYTCGECGKHVGRDARYCGNCGAYFGE